MANPAFGSRSERALSADGFTTLTVLLRTSLAAIIASAAMIVLATCGGQGDRTVTVPRCGSGGQGERAGPAARGGVPSFTHVAVIVFENKRFGDVIGARQAPTFNSLARRYALLSRYCGVAHPSLPNYLALVSGSTQGIEEDCNDCSVDAENLVDSLEADGRTWKTYAEGLPRPGYSGADAGRYAKRHNPFMYFEDVTDDPRRLSRIVPLEQLDRDLAANELPDFSLIIPDVCHDVHDCPLSTGDSWLGGFLPDLLESPQLGAGVVFIVFDEGDESDHTGSGGHIPALAVGPTVRPGARARASLNHYSLLRTIEDAWGLRKLGSSAGAQPIVGIWRHRR